MMCFIQVFILFGIVSAAYCSGAPPRFQDEHQTVAYIWPGKTINLTCNFVADSTAVVAWKKGDVFLVNNATYNIYAVWNNNLQVRMRSHGQTWIYGQYKCEVFNPFGKAVSTIELKEAKPPTNKLDIEIIEVEPTRVHLVVGGSQEKERLPVIGYRVQYSDRIVEFNNDHGEIQLNDLQPNTIYNIKISAKNEVGIGPSSDVTVRTSDIPAERTRRDDQSEFRKNMKICSETFKVCTKRWDDGTNVLINFESLNHESKIKYCWLMDFDYTCLVDTLASEPCVKTYGPNVPYFQREYISIRKQIRERCLAAGIDIESES